MRPLLAIAFVALSLMLAATGCSSRYKPPPTDGMDASAPDGPSNRSACIDDPARLPRPPAGQLPCELIPPGLQL